MDLVQKPRILQLLGLGIFWGKYCCGSRILKMLGLGYCKENRSRKLKMTLGENYILGLVYCKGLEGICEGGF